MRIATRDLSALAHDAHVPKELAKVSRKVLQKAGSLSEASPTGGRPHVHDVLGWQGACCTPAGL